LGSGTEHADKLSILWVLASHPATPDADTLAHLADADLTHCLIATVDLPSLVRRYSEKKILGSLKLRMTTSTSHGPQRNTDPDDEVEDPSSLDESEDPSSAHVDKKRRFK
jgi:hypothetical protein